MNGGFVAKLNPSGSALIASTLIEAGFTSTTQSVELDASGNIYAAGTAGGVGLTCGVSRYSGGYTPNLGGNAFVRKFNSDLSKVFFNHRLGPCGSVPKSLGLDPGGNLWLSGLAFPINPFPLVSPLSTFGLGFVSQLDPAGRILFSTLTDSTALLAITPSGSVSAVSYAWGGPEKASSLTPPVSVGWLKVDSTKN